MNIKPYKNNSKKHPKKQIEQVANSIKEFGMNQQIVVDKQGVIIVGHGRYEALKLLGMEIKPEYIKVVDLTGFDANLILTDILPEDLDEKSSDKTPQIKISFKSFEDLENAKIELLPVINNYKGAYLSVSGGEL